MFNDLFAAILPELQAILGLLLTAVASWAAFEVKKRFGVDVQIKQIEEGDRLRDLLTAALTTGVKAALLKAAVHNPDQVAEAAVDHVMRSVPDAVKKLGASSPDARNVLRNRALAILFDLKTPKS